MAMASPSALGTKPIQTLGAARTPTAAAYGGGGFQTGKAPVGGQPAASPGGQSMDPYGRLTTVGPGPSQGLGGLNVGADGNVSSAAQGLGPITIEQPPNSSAPVDWTPDMGGGARSPRGTTPGGSDPGPGGGLDMNQIMGVLDKLKPEPPPQRIQAPPLMAREGAPQPVASSAVKSQGFARAKDNAGRVANQALKSLRSEMVSRGIEGSGVEGQLASNVLGETARGVSDAGFQQERAAEDQEWQARQLGYQGGINQRAQDLGLTTSGYGGQVTQRGQDIGAQPNMLALAPTIFSMLNRNRY